MSVIGKKRREIELIGRFRDLLLRSGEKQVSAAAVARVWANAVYRIEARSGKTHRTLSVSHFKI